MKSAFATLACATLFCASAFSANDPVQAAAADVNRSHAEMSRDEYRHPQQTLRFFDIQPEMTVVEITPGGGWYSNILAPLLTEKGVFYAAHFYVDDSESDYFKNSRKAFEDKIESYAPYKKIKLTSFHPTKALKIAPEGTADRVLTFRNIHNWYMRQGEEGISNAFTAFYTSLKPGGVLGVVEHRLPENASDEDQKRSGYMKQSYVINAAEKAGFKLLASSEINANPLDTHDHPKGVWTLPPSLRLGEQDKAKYLAIGESDRMTLKFIKPE